MEQTDAFTQKRFELIIDMATKKLQQEISGLKENITSLNSEMGSLKSQISRLQFQPQQSHPVQKTLSEQQHREQSVEQKKEVKIVDCRPENERHEEFQSGASKNAEP